MSQQIINIGTNPSDGTGDGVRTAFRKTNANFSELYASLGDKAEAGDLMAEVTAREAADATLQDHIDTEATTRAAAITAEAAARSTAITAEAAARSAAITTETTARIAADALKADATALTAETAARIAADALKADLVGGVIPTAQIPAIAITTFLGSVSSQAAMLALAGQSGDWCNRSDTSTAWVVIGADPTQLSSWAQINYPASPVTSVNGQAGVVVLGKTDVGLGNVSNTSDAAKPVSTAQQAALDLKQDKSSLGADSAAAVHAATSKTTPVDADEIGLVDSAASNGLKKLTWANFKAAAKTYFDTLYAALTHAARHKNGGADAIKLDELAAGTTGGTALDASTTTHGLMSHADKSKLNGIATAANNYTLPAATPSLIGGVKRNVGTTGQYVTGIASDGSLTYDTPAGGGGGSALKRGVQSLQAYTTPGVDGTPPAELSLTFMDFMGDGTAMTLYTPAGTYRIVLASSNPGGFDIWVDISGVSDGYGWASRFGSTLSGYPNISVSVGGTVVYVDTSDIGSGVQLNATADNPGYPGVSGGGFGTDPISPSGATTEVTLVTALTAKNVKMVNGWWQGNIGGGVNVALFLVSSFGVGVQIAVYGNAGGGGIFEPDSGQLGAWINGLSANESLVARLVGGTLPTDGSTCVVGVACEQV